VSHDSRDVLAQVGAIITGSHIVYKAGGHGETYVNKDELYPHTRETARLCREIADQFSHADVKTVIAPAIGGVILSQWVASCLSLINGYEVFAVYAEKDVVAVQDPENKGRELFMETGRFVIKRGYGKHVTARNVLVVEDVLTTGGSARKVIEAVRAIGGHVVGLGALCNRGGVTVESLGKIPELHTLVDVEMDVYDPLNCPLCDANVPINTEVGHGKAFLERKKKA
jgi:orotate phosphoribosyltransferase